MYTKAEVIELFKSPDFVRKLALLWIQYGKWPPIEASLGIPQGTIEECFLESAELETIFDKELSVQTTKRVKRDSSHHLFSLMKKLQEIVEDVDDIDEDGKIVPGTNAIHRMRAATVLIGIYKASIIETAGKKDAGEKDELDKLYEEIVNERAG